MARFALLLMLGWMPGRVLAFASTARNPVKDEMQHELDARVAAGGGRQSRTMDSFFDDYLEAVWAMMNGGCWFGSCIFGGAGRRTAGVAGECGTCGWDNDGYCDDGGPSSEYSLCYLGSDCNDCNKAPDGDIRSAADCKAYYGPYILPNVWNSEYTVRWKYTKASVNPDWNSPDLRCHVTKHPHKYQSGGQRCSNPWKLAWSWRMGWDTGFHYHCRLV